eukprot:79306-Pyramimonas_sp.AAC.1
MDLRGAVDGFSTGAVLVISSFPFDFILFPLILFRCFDFILLLPAFISSDVIPMKRVDVASVNCVGVYVPSGLCKTTMQNTHALSSSAPPASIYPMFTIYPSKPAMQLLGLPATPTATRAHADQVAPKAINV